MGVRFINTSGDPDVCTAAYPGEIVTKVRGFFVLYSLRGREAGRQNEVGSCEEGGGREGWRQK